MRTSIRTFNSGSQFGLQSLPYLCDRMSREDRLEAASYPLQLFKAAARPCGTVLQFAVTIQVPSSEEVFSWFCLARDAWGACRRHS
jgi:hypothetical protein